jgi:hypothetical protein
VRYWILVAVSQNSIVRYIIYYTIIFIQCITYNILMIDLDKVTGMKVAVMRRCQERIARAAVHEPVPVPSFGVTSNFKSRHGL